MADGIHMGWAVVAKQHPSGLVREATLKIFGDFLMGMMHPDDGFLVSGVNRHPLINLLGKINEFRHNYLLELITESTGPIYRNNFV